MLKLSTNLIRPYLAPARRNASRASNPHDSRRDIRVLGMRLPNPSATGWALIATGGVAALVLATVASASSSKPKPIDLPDIEPDLQCDPAPYDVDMDELVAAIGVSIASGERDQAIVATNVAQALFGAHPAGGVAQFPPGPTPLPGVLCVWSVVVFVVDDEFKARGLGDKPVPETPTGSLSWVVRGATDPGYPWEEPVLQTSNWPSPGMFVNVGQDGSWDPSQGYDSMIKAYLGTLLVMAGMDFSIAEQQGGLGQSLRKQLREAVTAVGGFNDLVYGQTNLNYAGGNDPNKPGGDPNKPMMSSNIMNEQGRGLNWLPRHKNIIQEIPAGQEINRATRLDGGKLGGSNGGNQQMVVWLAAPKISSVASGVLEYGQWSDGSSTLDPPPQIRRLGVNMHGVVLPGT